MPDGLKYIGRFAPSPTGPLHFGSLLAALASYLEAKKNRGLWLVRIEDLDKPREIEGAASTILQQLESFGFEWDGEIIYQSQRTELYADALNVLNQKNLIYACICSRKEIADSSITAGVDGVIYPKTCSNRTISPHKTAAFRIKTPELTIQFEDAIQGEMTQHLSRDVGDFVLKRKDGLFAYQLAVVVDDAAQNITHILRGADLLDSTPRQIYLQQSLNLNTPKYAHTPVACNTAGEKLSKQTLAPAITAENAAKLIYEALLFLGQHPPPEIKNATLAEVWHWTVTHWSLSDIPKMRNIKAI